MTPSRSGIEPMVEPRTARDALSTRDRLRRARVSCGPPRGASSGGWRWSVKNTRLSRFQNSTHFTHYTAHAKLLDRRVWRAFAAIPSPLLSRSSPTGAAHDTGHPTPALRLSPVVRPASHAQRSPNRAAHSPAWHKPARAQILSKLSFLWHPCQTTCTKVAAAVTCPSTSCPSMSRAARAPPHWIV